MTETVLRIVQKKNLKMKKDGNIADGRAILNYPFYYYSSMWIIDWGG